ncbi:MAG: nucleoside 2-deoxyribosyltransferase [Bacteroidetes bacterium]|nr:nucleoside 2-deoxyribosyltransferase [Bacteroidota bacterium]
MTKKVYLAGPEVFLPNAVEIGARKKKLCRKYGFSGVFPIDVKIDILNLGLTERGFKISQINEDLIRGCDLVIANITPFRGPSADPGTVYEVGFAKGLGKPVYGYTNTTELFRHRTLKYLDHLPNSGSGYFGNRMDMQIENYDMADNLMIDAGIQTSGGTIHAVNIPVDEIYTDLTGFEKCLMAAKESQ